MATETVSMLEMIIAAPTVVNSVHESVYRQAFVLRYVRWLLTKDTPHEVVLRIMDDLDGLPQKGDALPTVRQP